MSRSGSGQGGYQGGARNDRPSGDRPAHGRAREEYQDRPGEARPKRLSASGQPGFTREWEPRGTRTSSRESQTAGRAMDHRSDSAPGSQGSRRDRFDSGVGSPASRQGFSQDRAPGGREPRAPRQQMADPVARRRVRLDESAGWDRDVEAGSSHQSRSVTPELKEAPKRNRQRQLPEGVSKELQSALGARRGGRVSEALVEASKAYERDRFTETLRILRPLIEEAPDSAAIRELYGLACYRENKWAEAVKHLSAFVDLTASVEQHPVLADAHRALKHHDQVALLWAELAQSSPGAHLVAEGRIVMAGSLADQNRLAEAILLLERGALSSKSPRDHHLRMWYSLADLYERAGDLPRARERFQRIMQSDPSFVNVAERVANLH